MRNDETEYNKTKWNERPPTHTPYRSTCPQRCEVEEGYKQMTTNHVVSTMYPTKENPRSIPLPETLGTTVLIIAAEPWEGSLYYG